MNMDRKAIIIGGAFLALTLLVILAGCIKGPDVTYDYGLSEPYNVSGVVEMRINATAYITINNSGGGDMRFMVENATLSANFEDGSVESVQGVAQGGDIPAGGSYQLNLSFERVPVKYALADNPARFHPLISSYDINVTSRGQEKILFLWSPWQVSRKDMRIPMKDMPIGDYLAKVKDSMVFAPGD